MSGLLSRGLHGLSSCVDAVAFTSLVTKDHFVGSAIALYGF
jgi:hypothetical protein